MTRPIPPEPEPIWPEAPRLTSRPFPSYRFVRGLNPHPVRSLHGHSHGRSETAPDLPPERWRENELYCFGIDLYHASYFWEAHEAWEAIWQRADRDGAEGLFLQGLIQNAAALIKVHERSRRGARNLSRSAAKNLRAAQSAGAGDRFMGIRLAELLAEMERYYGRLWADPAGEGLPLDGRPPRLRTK